MFTHIICAHVFYVHSTFQRKFKQKTYFHNFGIKIIRSFVIIKLDISY